MKKHINDLTDDELNWVISDLEKDSYYNPRDHAIRDYINDWNLGGPVFEREIDNHQKRVGYFYCNRYKRPGTLEHNITVWATGKTLLRAAMKCYANSILGYEIEIPENIYE